MIERIFINPVTGGAGASLAFVIPFFDNYVTPSLQYIGLLAGVLIACLTVYKKILEIKKLKNGNSNK